MPAYSQAPRYWATGTAYACSTAIQWGYVDHRVGPISNHLDRMFVSDMPETIITTGASRKLWEDYAQGKNEVTYHVYLYHVNGNANPIDIGLVMENLVPTTTRSLSVFGQYRSTLIDLTPPNGMKNYHNELAQEFAYSVLTSPPYRFVRMGTTYLVPASPTQLIAGPFTVPSGYLLLAEFFITVHTSQSPVRCRLASVWNNSPTTPAILVTASNSPLAGWVAPPGNHQRGTWLSATIALNNAQDVIDLNKMALYDTIQLPICFTRSHRRFPNDMIHNRDNSFFPNQAEANKGMYNVVSKAYVYVTNTNNNTAMNIGIYLQQLTKPNPGLYNGGLGMIRALNITTGANTTINDIRGVALQGTGNNLRRTEEMHCQLILPNQTYMFEIWLLHGANSTLPVSILLRRE